YGAAITLNSASPTVTYSAITSNYSGIVANGASNPVVNYCDIYKNSQYGINNVNKSFTINAQNNWWGNNTGPTHSGNFGGTGDVVTDGVNYSPFLTSGATNPLDGDVSLNGRIQAYDASLVLRWLVDTTANPLTALQQQVADVSNNGTITAFDASLILQYVVGKINIFPSVLQNGPTLRSQLSKSTSIASVEISDGAVERGNRLTTTLTAHGLKDVYSADIVLTYNKEHLTPVSVNVAGIAEGALTETSIHDGVIRIMLASATPLQGDGAMFRITFGVVDELRGSVKSPITFSQFLANEKDMKSATSGGMIEVTGKPTSFGLDQNYPNPFNPSTTISYQVPDDGLKVRIDIYSLTGQLVKTLFDGVQQAGEHRITWDGRNSSGQQVSSGVYLFRMTGNNFVNVRKMLMLK
ncbi:MAG: T9SS type A sorting domain-containing protein, partial [Ignavibacteriales bacterium]|nr:T9SS type A sorting domain-containing protein [Ignavibacteriales bacterium]